MSADTMRAWKQTILIGVVLLGCVGCDQITKELAQMHLRSGEKVLLLNGAVELSYRENAGVVFGLGAELPNEVRNRLFIGGIIVILLGMAAYGFRRCGSSTRCHVALALLVGGGLGNLIDRLVNDGRVIDFMLLSFGSVRTAVFNLADVLVLIGISLIVSGAVRRESGLEPAATAGS